MSTAIIMPTVNVPTNLDEWSKMLDPSTDIIIIAGNERSPHDDIQRYLDTLSVKTEYLHPSDHWVNLLRVNRYLEPNHHHRRNLALARALVNAPDVVVTIDDDNYPTRQTWLQQVTRILSNPNESMKVVHSESGWWNAAGLCVPSVTHRGYPVSRRTMTETTEQFHPGGEMVGVFASLWTGDPDIDAMERMVKNPTVNYVADSAVLAPGTWCPFDSQATAVRSELAAMMYMWTGVGRYDDIFASYLMRAVMDPLGYHVAYGHPTVRQDRNEHDLIKDLKMELFGLTNTERMCDVLRNISAMIVDDMKDDGDRYPFGYFAFAVDAIVEALDVPTTTIEGLQAWVSDVNDLVN